MKFKNAPVKQVLLKIIMLAFLSVSYSCKKDKEVKADQITMNEAEKWLQQQKLTKHYGLQASKIQQFDNDGKITMAISLPDIGYEGKTITYSLWLIFKDQTGQIVGNRLYYSPNSTPLPTKELINFANDKNVTGEQINGIVLLYTMNGKLLKHSENLKENKFTITKNRIPKKTSGSNSNNGKVSLTPISELNLLNYYPVPGGPTTGPPAGCFDLFTVYDDGHFVTSVVFMGRRCGALAEAELEGDTEHWIVRGGGETSSPVTCETVEKNFASSTASDFISSAFETQAATTRTKIYKWVFHKNHWGLWKYVSRDKGKHYKSGTEWKWTSLEHVSEALEGLVAGGTLECQGLTSNATIGVYNATMELSYTLKATPIITGCPISISDGYNAAKLFTVNE